MDRDGVLLIGGEDRPKPKGIWRGNGEWHPLFVPAEREANVAAPEPAPQKQVEVCRSFAYKLNLANHGGPQYESADFFCSRKIACGEEDAGWVSQNIFEECVTEIHQATVSFIQTMQQRLAESRQREAARREAERPQRPASHPTGEVMRRR